MGDGTKIQWATDTLNFATGCTRVSPGCDKCYMQSSYNRWKGMGNKGYPADAETVTLLPERLDYLERKLGSWRSPHKVFINSMGDTFHHDVPWSMAERLLTMFAAHPMHVAQVLTKRPGRMAWFAEHVWAPRPWPANVWAGTSVESAKYLPRLDVLARVPAAVRFVSLEPMLARFYLGQRLASGNLRRGQGDAQRLSNAKRASGLIGDEVSERTEALSYQPRKAPAGGCKGKPRALSYRTASGHQPGLSYGGRYHLAGQTYHRPNNRPRHAHA